MSRYAILLCVSMGILTAADGTKLAPPALGRLPKADFERLLSKALSEGNKSFTAEEIARLGNQQVQCAIPLLETKANPGEKFDMPRLNVRSDDRMAVAPPLPACKTWNGR